MEQFFVMKCFFLKVFNPEPAGSYLRLIDLYSLNSRLESNKEGKKNLLGRERRVGEPEGDRLLRETERDRVHLCSLLLRASA